MNQQTLFPRVDISREKAASRDSLVSVTAVPRCLLFDQDEVVR
jgi:hypothetical protein